MILFQHDKHMGKLRDAACLSYSPSACASSTAGGSAPAAACSHPNGVAATTITTNLQSNRCHQH
jgi:hypothetical protein